MRLGHVSTVGVPTLTRQRPRSDSWLDGLLPAISANRDSALINASARSRARAIRADGARRQCSQAHRAPDGDVEAIAGHCRDRFSANPHLPLTLSCHSYRRGTPMKNMVVALVTVLVIVTVGMPRPAAAQDSTAG